MPDQLTVDATALADDVCTLMAQVLQHQRAGRDDVDRVMMLAHCVRMLRFGQGAVALMHAGNYEPACALTRVVLEMGWVLLAIEADPTQMDHWMAQGHGERRKAMQGLSQLRDEERPVFMTEEYISAVVDSLPKGTPYQAHHWASRSGGPAAYVTLYRQLSDCSHAGPQATGQYLKIDDTTGLPQGIKVVQGEGLAADGMSVVSALLLDALRYISEGTATAGELRAIEVLESQLKPIVARVNASMEDGSQSDDPARVHGNE